MPGGYGSNAHEDISGANIYYGSGWHEMDGSPYNQDSDYFGLYQASDADINIWDKACPS